VGVAIAVAPSGCDEGNELVPRTIDAMVEDASADTTVVVDTFTEPETSSDTFVDTSVDTSDTADTALDAGLDTYSDTPTDADASDGWPPTK
jgi:hypothetical protein